VASEETKGDKEPVAEEKASAPAQATEANAAETAPTSTGEDATDAINENAVVEEVSKKKMIVQRQVSVSKSTLYMGLEVMTPEMYDKPTVFFVRTTDGAIPLVTGPDIMDHIEFNVLPGDVLFGIANIISQVYVPVVQKGTLENDSELSSAVGKKASTSGPSDVYRQELCSNMVKFEQQLRHEVQQSRGDVRLIIPNIVITSPEAALDDITLINEIESTLEDWTASIAAAVEAEHQKPKTVKNPVAEIDFWRDRNANLSALFGQINTPKVQQMLQVMKLMDNPQLNGFNFHFSELSKLYLEAKDNVKFLTTLERHFRHLIDDPFQTILATMPSMINGLRMVWVISRHYNTDERMAPLMETIGETLAGRVRDEVRLSDVLIMDYPLAKGLVQEAKDILTHWSENYFRMRKRIEESGSDHRWEFDRKALFGRTDYMAEICSNILEILDALEQFKVFLGPELKAVTGESGGIDDVLKRVEALTIPLKVPFEEKIFDKSYEKPWEAIMKKFRSNVIEIQQVTEVFIKESFRKLRSAEGAFELVQNFQKIGGPDVPPPTSSGQSSFSLKQQISGRYKDILEQYVRELDSIKAKFNNLKERPPIYKNYPPVAGAISWARDLYHRAKRPILRFKKHNLLDDDFGDKVKLNYLEFARSVDSYIADLYNDWETNIASTATEKLKGSVLRSIAQYAVAKSSDKDKNVDVTAFVLPPAPYRVNFSHELKMIIKESRYLDKLGFRIPENALNVTLQENKYQEIVRSLNSKLHEYDRLMSTMKSIEKQLLKASIDDLNATIKIGFYPLNWTSQRLHAYIEDFSLALVRFGSVISQIQKNAAMIEDVINKISSTLLLQAKDFMHADGSVTPSDVSEFYELMEQKRVARLESLVTEYNSIGESFLMKVEEVVAKTATGCSPVLAGYYHYWEKCVFNAIAQMIVGSMAALLGILQCKDGSPLFRVTVSLNGKELSVSPPLTEVDKLLTKGIRNMAESAMYFVRWMHGTCIQTEPQVINDDDEPFVFSFYQDISQNPQVVKLALALSSQTNKVYSITNKYLDGWRRYDKVTNLWNPKRKQQIEKLRPLVLT